MQMIVNNLFRRYSRVFNESLHGDVDTDAVASLYAACFVAASPAGVSAGNNDDEFRDAMVRGYARYKAMGTKEMRIRDTHISPIDAMHCVAHVAWTATYCKPGLAETSIDFDVHYLVQVRDGEARVFGWVSGDEEALLKQHGIV